MLSIVSALFVSAPLQAVPVAPVPPIAPVPPVAVAPPALPAPPVAPVAPIAPVRLALPVAPAVPAQLAPIVVTGRAAAPPAPQRARLVYPGQDDGDRPARLRRELAPAAQNGTMGVQIGNQRRTVEGDEVTSVVVLGVLPGSVAEDAGFQAQDRILAVAGKNVSDVDALTSALADKRPGDEVEVVVQRGDQQVTMRFGLGGAGGRPVGDEQEVEVSELAPGSGGARLRRFGRGESPFGERFGFGGDVDVYFEDGDGERRTFVWKGEIDGEDGQFHGFFVGPDGDERVFEFDAEDLEDGMLELEELFGEHGELHELHELFGHDGQLHELFSGHEGLRGLLHGGAGLEQLFGDEGEAEEWAEHFEHEADNWAHELEARAERWAAEMQERAHTWEERMNERMEAWGRRMEERAHRFEERMREFEGRRDDASRREERERLREGERIRREAERRVEEARREAERRERETRERSSHVERLAQERDALQDEVEALRREVEALRRELERRDQ